MAEAFTQSSSNSCGVVISTMDLVLRSVESARNAVRASPATAHWPEARRRGASSKGRALCLGYSVKKRRPFRVVLSSFALMSIPHTALARRTQLPRKRLWQVWATWTRWWPRK